MVGAQAWHTVTLPVRGHVIYFVGSGALLVVSLLMAGPFGSHIDACAGVDQQQKDVIRPALCIESALGMYLVGYQIGEEACTQHVCEVCCLLLFRLAQMTLFCGDSLCLLGL